MRMPGGSDICAHAPNSKVNQPCVCWAFETNGYLSWEIYIFKLLGLRQVLNSTYNREWSAQCARGTEVRIQLSRRFNSSLAQDLGLQGRS